MKYLQQLDTEYEANLEIKMSPFWGGYWPMVSVFVNHAPIMMQHLCETLVIQHQPHVKAGLYIRVVVDSGGLDLDDNLFDTGITIDNIWVDGRDVTDLVMPRAWTKSTVPNQVKAPSMWEFDAMRPFYAWLHDASGQGWLLQPDP
jgi:hypothetical protein